MITDERTSRVLARAKQRRADFIGDFLARHPVAAVFVLGVALLATAIDWTPDVTTASNEAGQVTDVSKR